MQMSQFFQLNQLQPQVIETVCKILLRLVGKLSKEHYDELTQLAGGKDLGEIAEELRKSLDRAEQILYVRNFMKIDREPTEAEIKIAYMEMTKAAFKPFQNPKLCTRLMEIKQLYPRSA